MKGKIELAYDSPEVMRDLFREYTNFLISNDRSISNYLKIQNYDTELQHLNDKYGPPRGRLYLLTVDGKAAGCIGLREINQQICEMKRLYVKPEFRGQNFANDLVNKIIQDAKIIGYQAILLDTLPFLQGAIHLYKKLGFYGIPCYNNSPLAESIYMKLDLKL